MKILIIITGLFASFAAQADTLKNLEDALDRQFGYNIENIYCAKQLKPHALEALSQVDKSSCGFGAANVVNAVIETMPIQDLLSLRGIAYNSVQVPDSNECRADSPLLKNTVAITRVKGHQNCLDLGHSTCEELEPRFTFTSDGYCVVVVYSQGAPNAGMVPNIARLLDARSLLQKAIDLYHVYPCDSAQADNLISKAQALIQSTTLVADPSDPLNQFNMCAILN